MDKLPYFDPELGRENMNANEQSIESVVSLLADTRLQSEIEAGNVTLAMVRPNVGPEANVLNLPDIEAAEKIEEMIEGLGIVAKFSIKFTTEMAQEFYKGDPHKSMLKETPANQDKYETKWPEFIDLMTAGPTTVIILYSPDGNAISKWREHLGHWNIDKIRDPQTIRGKFGTNRHNNLVHGSDAPSSVTRELEIIKSVLRNSLSNHG